MRRLALAAALLCGTALTASAQTLRWANDGDVNSMDPYTRNETLLLAFNSHIYEPLVRREPEHGAGARAGRALGDSPRRRYGASTSAAA